MNCCGVLNIDKPSGLTSREVVDRVVQLVRPAKVGHAGTLDPLATGVLIVCVGHATRLINIVQEGRKQYQARFLLGKQSDTDDITGQVTHSGDCSKVTNEQVAELLKEFVGRTLQVPPQFSAVHVEGQRAYDLARRGQTVKIAARPVDVYSLSVTEFQLPEIELKVECGSGTYIRSIGRDLGFKLGCGAVMTHLKRLSVGRFPIEGSIALSELSSESLGRSLQSPLEIVKHFPIRRLSADEVLAVRRGQKIASKRESFELQPTADSSDHLMVCDSRVALVLSDGTLLGIGEDNDQAMQIQPRIIFPAETDESTMTR